MSGLLVMIPSGPWRVNARKSSGLSGSDRLEKLLSEKGCITRSDLEGIGYSRASAAQELNSPLEQGRLEKIGGGRDRAR